MSNWQIPTELPDLRRVSILALDTETKDDRLRDRHGFRLAVPVRLPVRRKRRLSRRRRRTRTLFPDPPSRHRELRSRSRSFSGCATTSPSDVRFVTQNGLYDWGWLRAEAGIRMPPGESSRRDRRARHHGGRESLSHTASMRSVRWRGLPGKDETLLRQESTRCGLITSKRKKVSAAGAPLAAAGALCWPVRRGRRRRTRFCCGKISIQSSTAREPATPTGSSVDLLPLVLEMRRRGIRIDPAAAETCARSAVAASATRC